MEDWLRQQVRRVESRGLVCLVLAITATNLVFGVLICIWIWRVGPSMASVLLLIWTWGVTPWFSNHLLHWWKALKVADAFAAKAL